MKKSYLVLCMVGTVLPNVFVIRESLATGNIMLYRHLDQTIASMFGNNISTAFIIDLLFIVVLFMAWSYKDAKKNDVKGIFGVWLYTFALGIAGGLPLYLYLRERRRMNA